jgi:hypothetical protein
VISDINKLAKKMWTSFTETHSHRVQNIMKNNMEPKILSHDSVTVYEVWIDNPIY